MPPPLETLRVAHLPQFELWLTLQQELFGRLHDALTARLLERYRQMRDWHNMIDVALHALHVGQWQESTYIALIEAYARLGERAKALHVYDQMSRWLDQAHGFTPSDESRQLQRLILDDALWQAQQYVDPSSRLVNSFSSITQHSHTLWDSIKDNDEDGTP